jgi:hypothetical protein
MKLSDYMRDSQEFSAKASDLSRQLAFAGIAIIWIFAKQDNSSLTIPKELIRPALLFCISLALDLTQYVVLTAIWTLFHRHHEKKLAKVDDDPELVAPVWFGNVGWVFFWMKISVVATAYGFTLAYLSGLLGGSR